MAEKVVSKLRGNMWRLIILAVAGSLIYGLPYFRTYYYDAYLQAYNLTNTQMGVFGSIFGEWILRRCGVRDAEARGFALGAAAHGIGTARAIEIGAVEGALSGLAMALMGLATALLMPLMEKYLY